VATDDRTPWNADDWAEEARDCVSGRYTALHGEDRANEILRGAVCALLANHCQWREGWAAVLAVLGELREAAAREREAP
jgi:hypothetical protein